MTENSQKTARSIVELTCEEAKEFLLKQESYHRNSLPSYFQFNGLLGEVVKALLGKDLNGLRKEDPRSQTGVNYLLLENKDGRYSWRPIELIHPALYVSLVNSITEGDAWSHICSRFEEFSESENIRCLSLPVESLTDESDKAEQISQWWQEIEQKSVEYSLDYEFLVQTDIVDCYAAIYTHSISWALHTKAKAKREKESPLIGNTIDKRIREMRNGQTNGIPQGSVLMDFVAEIVLGYADLELNSRIECEKIKDYQILRYRDDYRIFVNNLRDGEIILKCLTEVHHDLGLSLSPEKTRFSSDVIRSSFKADKLSWILKKQVDRNLHKRMLIIHDHSLQHPNSGSLAVAMSDFHRIIHRCEKLDLPLPLISIVVDIAYRNPRSYEISAAILSKLASFVASSAEKQKIIERIRRRFSRVPNTGYLEIWLQRISLEFGTGIPFEEPLCKLVRKEDVTIWNNDWLSAKDLKSAIDPSRIIDQEELQETGPIVSPDEVKLYNFYML